MSDRANESPDRRDAATLKAASDRLARKRDVAEALLAEPLAADAPALAGVRAAGRQRFLDMGAPVRRDEYWRFADPAALTAPMASARAGGVSARGSDAFDGVNALTLVFDAGRYRADLSDADAEDGLEIAPLAEAAAAGWALDALGKLERRGHEPVARPFAALNAALLTDGVAIRARTSVARPVRLQHLGGGAGASYSRAIVSVARGAELTILEAGEGALRRNTVLEADIGEGAALHHLRVQAETRAEAQATTHVFARLDAGATLKSFTLTAGGGQSLARNEYVLWLDGEGGSAHVAGGVVAGGQAALDNTLFLTHGAERCQSRQVFKNVVAERARAIFQGKILVQPGAQKTDGYQISQAVLLDETAAFHAKPELEIYADDVICSHGSTTGALDESHLFYLRARGVAAAVARRLLTLAFLEESVAEVADPALRDILRAEAERLIAATAPA